MKIKIIKEENQEINNFDIASAVSNAIYEVLDTEANNINLDYETIVKLLVVECE
jgi:hypothetical protein